MEKESLMRMAKGAFEDRVDTETAKVIDNILDPNTKATQKRRIVLSIDFIPDEERRLINVSVQVKTALAPTNAMATSLYITADALGELAVTELTPQVPGQFSMDGEDEPAPKVLKLAAGSR